MHTTAATGGIGGMSGPMISWTKRMHELVKVHDGAVREKCSIVQQPQGFERWRIEVNVD